VDNPPTDALPERSIYPVVIKPLHSKVAIQGQLCTLSVRVCRDPGERLAAYRELLPHTPVVEQEYFRAQKDPEFQRELDYYLHEFCGRPTPLYLAERLTRQVRLRLVEVGTAGLVVAARDRRHGGGRRRGMLAQY